MSVNDSRTTHILWQIKIHPITDDFVPRSGKVRVRYDKGNMGRMREFFRWRVTGIDSQKRFDIWILERFLLQDSSNMFFRVDKNSYVFIHVLSRCFGILLQITRGSRVLPLPLSDKIFLKSRSFLSRPDFVNIVYTNYVYEIQCHTTYRTCGQNTKTSMNDPTTHYNGVLRWNSRSIKLWR